MRYTGTIQKINYSATLDFFDSRGRGASDSAPLTATMYQDRTLAERRDAWERAKVLPLLDPAESDRVLDIGCGYGRWGEVLAPRVAHYLGVDFSGELLRLARARSIQRARFLQMAAQDIGSDALKVGGLYSLFICSGILIYLNDADVLRLARGIAGLAAPQARVYLREPMATTGSRLTLDRVHSQELNCDYSAIYRTPEQCHTLFGERLSAAGFVCDRQEALYPPELCNRKETEQQIQIWTRIL